MPVLSRAEAIDVMSVDGPSGMVPGPSAAEIAESLRRHGLNVTSQHVKSGNRSAGQTIVDTAIAGGAEEVFIPEEEQDVDAVCTRLSAEAERRTSAVVVVAEGDELGGAAPIAAHFKERGGFD
jgi:hypothetical protein